MTREEFITEARKTIGARFSHQGRNFSTGFDCGGVVLVLGQTTGLSELEELGYSSFPMNGRFEQLLEETTDYLGTEYAFPFNFTGDEFLLCDLISFDYGNGEGIRHLGLCTGWRQNCYWIIDAQPNLGVTEHPLRFPFVKQRTTLKGWRIRGLV